MLRKRGTEHPWGWLAAGCPGSPSCSGAGAVGEKGDAEFKMFESSRDNTGLGGTQLEAPSGMLPKMRRVWRKPGRGSVPWGGSRDPLLWWCLFGSPPNWCMAGWGGWWGGRVGGGMPGGAHMPPACKKAQGAAGQSVLVGAGCLQGLGSLGLQHPWGTVPWGGGGGGSRAVAASSPPLSARSKLTRESGTDFPIPVIPPVPDAETEKLIREKDEEVSGGAQPPALVIAPYHVPSPSTGTAARDHSSCTVPEAATPWGRVRRWWRGIRGCPPPHTPQGLVGCSTQICLRGSWCGWRGASPHPDTIPALFRSSCGGCRRCSRRSRSR